MTTLTANSGVELRRASLPSGHEIEYLEAGTGDPLVFFHGAGGVDRKARFIPDLGRTFRVLAPARPGFDGSTGETANSRDEAEVMAAFIRQVAGGPAHLVAESAGGAAGAWLAVLYPDLVKTLVLVAPGAFAPHRAPAAGSAPPSPQELERRLFGEHPARVAPEDDADRERRRRNASANAARLRPADGNRELLERLGEIQAPTLVLWGSADEMIPAEAGTPFMQRVPNVRRVFVYGGAHSLPVAACDRFVKLTTEFVERGEAFIVNNPTL